ncbi:LysR family transcriptional regulator [Cupriavidus pauculus]|uniref:LysR family transcriptional regulator n=1 Tax=Cupriavidus pauculus TaxID=82633 RepID=UPI001EE22BA3|nr:LysR family transcriptional regulator [Cupriavidus pauculus]GJG98666.1 LysR family transcriptional regulator [Cupriavidus pauculus]
MDQLLAMRVFRAIVDAGGFSAAAERLGVSHSTVSRQLKQLESEMGVQLLHRNTRRLALTDAGERYHGYCVDILSRIDAMNEAMTGDGQHLAGPLRVTVPLAIGTLELQDWLPAFRALYPDIRLDLSCNDQFFDLVGAGFDVALRISAAPLADSSLMARVLAASDMVLVASPAYIDAHGMPASPAELAAHQLLAFSGAPQTLTLTDVRGQAEQVAMRGMLTTDAITALHASALAGAGIAAFTERTARTDLARGGLVRVLPQYHAGTSHYYALYPQTRHLAPRARAFIDFMATHYRMGGD